MLVRHNTALLEQALEHVVKRASIPLLQAEANALERTNRSFAIRRVATGVAVAIAAVGIGFALYLILPYFFGKDPPIIAQGPDQLPPERKPPQPGPKEPEDVTKQDPLPPSPQPKEHVVKFKDIEIRLAGRSWLVSAGHHFESADDVSWRNAWCYTVTRPKGVEVRVQLADRANPTSRPTAPVSGLETLEAAGLSIPEAFALASKCAWLDRTFTVNELEATSHARNPFPKDPLVTELTNRVLKVSGSIGAEFVQAVGSHDFDILEINSGGGIIEDAMRVGRLLRRQGKDVRVSGNCLSACVLVLAGGVYRDAMSGARVGVHRFRGMQTTEKDIEIGQQKSSEIITYLRDMGIEIDLFQAAAAVSSDDMSYLSRPDMEKWKLLNGPRPVATLPPTPQDQSRVMVPKPLPNGRMEISSKAGWTLSYAPELFALDPAVSDKFDDKEQTWDTNLRSVQHLPEAITFIQVSINKLCREQQKYAEQQIQPKRDPNQVTRSEPLGSETHTSYVIEGRGVALTRSTFDQRGYFDWVAMRQGDQSTIIHVGGKFPAEHAPLYREEMLKMLRTLKLPEQDPFTKKCVS